MPEDVLKATLLDMLYELRDSEISLIIGGGYGLFLKQMYLAAAGRTRTLFPPETWPQPRSTNDIDVLLRPFHTEHERHSVHRSSCGTLATDVITSGAEDEGQKGAV